MKYLNILILYIVLIVPFVQWPGSVLNRGLENLLKAVVFFYFAVFLVDSLRRLKILLFVILGCQVIRVLEPLYLHVTTGYWGSKANMGDGQWLARLAGAAARFHQSERPGIRDSHPLPFLHYLLGGSPRRLLKVLYIALLPLLLYAFILTGSRSGFVGLAVVVAVILWRSRQRVALDGDGRHRRGSHGGRHQRRHAGAVLVSGRERYPSLPNQGWPDRRHEARTSCRTEAAAVRPWPRHVAGSHVSFRWPWPDTPIICTRRP